MNVLKKPQHVGICQCVQHVEQLNSYVAQLPCWYYSPSTKPSMLPMNMLFSKADLVNHLLWMCPQLILYKKGMTPVHMCLLLLSFNVIECMCTNERLKEQSDKKASHKSKKG
jgi:hypothetical protein